MNRAFVSLEIKALEDDARLIEGIATTPRQDRMGDVVLPKGAKFKLPLPFLLDHDHRQAVGEVDHVEVTDDGIKFKAHIKRIDEPGEVQQLTDKAWQLVKNGLRRAVSIGFAPLEFEPLPKGGLLFSSWEWLELSAVSVPAQADAVISSTKSYALSGGFAAIDPEFPTEEPPAPAATGREVRVVRLVDPARDRAKPFVIREIKR